MSTPHGKHVLSLVRISHVYTSRQTCGLTSEDFMCLHLRQTCGLTSEDFFHFLVNLFQNMYHGSDQHECLRPCTAHIIYICIYIQPIHTHIYIHIHTHTCSSPLLQVPRWHSMPNVTNMPFREPPFSMTSMCFCISSSSSGKVVC